MVRLPVPEPFHEKFEFPTGSPSKEAYDISENCIQTRIQGIPKV